MTRSPNLPSHSAWVHRLKMLRARLPVSTIQPEESLALRGLVQLLVSVGMASVSVAAAGVVEASLVTLFAIPLSAAGGYWSWRSRKHPNIAVKFLIALGMLAALGGFLIRLVGEGGDTRIQLAELLIQLQVLHSFDMPRRKDLGYSIVIGLILLGVSATVSQTLVLAPVLVAFLAIALPVLMLDYRSRLGIASTAQAPPVRTVKLKQLTSLLLVVMGIGLAIFAALPRLPGYQIRNFPVSDTLTFQGEFSGDQIYNSGYLAGGAGAGEGTTGEGADGQILQGGTPEVGPGNIDGQTYYGFNQRINQNLRGTLTPQVIMRVRSQAPGFWRVLAFDRYTGQGWEISRGGEADVEVLPRSPFSYKISLPPAAFKLKYPNQKGRRREVVQTLTMVNDLPNLIPVLNQATDLYFPTSKIAIDPEGSLRAPLPLSNGLTFTAISQVPYRDRTQLGAAGTDYPQDIRAAYLEIPAAIGDRVQAQTESLLARAPQPLSNPYEKALFLAQALKQNYTLQENLPFFAPEEDLVEAFLFRYAGGYADHFSTALTVMLRSIGIPARLVTGFAPGRFNPFTGYYVISNTDAYALSEVYFPGYGWFVFDPIPGHEVIPPSIRDSQTFSVLRQFWNWVAGWLPSPVAGWLSGGFVLLITVLSRFLNLFSQGALGIITGLLCLTAIAFLGWLSWRGYRRWRRRVRLQRLPPIEQAYQHLLFRLANQGYPKSPTQTPLEYATALAQNPKFKDPDRLRATIQSYLRWRYGHYPEDVAAFKRQVAHLTHRHPRSS